MPKNQSANQQTKIIAIIGPTASGKSDLGIFLAKKFHGEIISADSRQVYKGMDIGTGKVTKKEQKLVKHHLLDVVNPKKVFTVSDFKKLGEKSIKAILNKHKTPFIVGGTGFYVDALIKDTSLPEVPPDKKIRSKLEKQPAETLYKELRRLDHRRAKTIDRYNKRRLIRALEIIKTTGQPIPTIKEFSRYETLYIGINPPKEILKKKIALRLKSRIKQGMIREVIKLHKQGVSWRRLDSFGLEYKQISRWLKNSGLKQKQSFSNSQEYENLLKDIIKYSKRQMTWFKRNKEIHWLNPSANGLKEAEKLVEQFISHP
jgi:tRNA dimethylallyltransferase